MNQPRKPINPNLVFLPRTDEELDRLAEITPADIEAAQNWGAVTKNKTAAALLEAKEDERE